MNILLFLKGLTSFGSYRPNFLTEFEIWLQNDLPAMKLKILRTIFHINIIQVLRNWAYLMNWQLRVKPVVTYVVTVYMSRLVYVIG